MELLPNIEAIDLAIYLVKHKTLIVSDFHLGYESSMIKRGVMLPKQQYAMTIERLDNIFSRVNPETIIINGDLKHDFGSISYQEWSEVSKLIEYLETKCKNLILIKGNHDTILKPIADKYKIKVETQHVIGDIMIIHGDAIPKEPKKIIIVGHEHPAISLKMEGRTEKYKCFLTGKYASSEIIVQPSFNLLTEGSDIIREQKLSPILKKVSDFDVYVVGKEVIFFGKLSKLIRMKEV